MLCEQLKMSYQEVVERFAPSASDQGFGSTLRKARILKGLKHDEAAKIAGIDPTTLRKWERLPGVPPKWVHSKLERLCQVLDMDRLEIEMGKDASSS